MINPYLLAGIFLCLIAVALYAAHQVGKSIETEKQLREKLKDMPVYHGKGESDDNK